MTKVTFPIAAFLFLILVFISCEDKQFISPDRPNIVYLLADDPVSENGIWDLAGKHSNPEFS